VDHLRIRLSAPTVNGFKGIARRGKTVQEVFFTGSVGQAELQAVLDQAVKREQGR
jgi:hypothetical protein